LPSCTGDAIHGKTIALALRDNTSLTEFDTLLLGHDTEANAQVGLTFTRNKNIGLLLDRLAAHPILAEQINGNHNADVVPQWLGITIFLMADARLTPEEMQERFVEIALSVHSQPIIGERLPARPIHRGPQQ
jgi:hypothetical protein